jgi:plasmid stabilization system protein ParE
VPLIEWTPTARSDLLEILDYIAERNEKAADRLFERIEQDLEHAAEHPYLFKSSERVPGLREIVTHPMRAKRLSIEGIRLAIHQPPPEKDCPVIMP